MFVKTHRTTGKTTTKSIQVMFRGPSVRALMSLPHAAALPTDDAEPLYSVTTRPQACESGLWSPGRPVRAWASCVDIHHYSLAASRLNWKGGTLRNALGTEKQPAVRYHNATVLAHATPGCLFEVKLDEQSCVRMEVRSACWSGMAQLKSPNPGTNEGPVVRMTTHTGLRLLVEIVDTSVPGTSDSPFVQAVCSQFGLPDEADHAGGASQTAKRQKTLTSYWPSVPRAA